MLPRAADELSTEYATRLLAGALPLQPLTPAASARRYYRPLEPRARGWLLVRGSDPPPVATALVLRSAGVRVPRLGATAPGHYLVEDLGDRHLAHAPTPVHYQAVLAAAEALGHQCLPSTHPNAALALDETLFRRELRQFRESWVQALRRRAWSPADADRIDMRCAELAGEAVLGPWRLQHRDLHSRNVLLPSAGPPALIDHQDMRRGPLFYDLASLRTDAYVDLGDAVQDRLEAATATLGAAHGLDAAATARRFKATALQRVLKALGTFGTLIAMRGRTEYRDIEARARRHAQALLAPDDRWSAFREWLD
ncbi:MAG TPA: phosphotransferase [Planctomycetota bacterium]